MESLQTKNYSWNTHYLHSWSVVDQDMQTYSLPLPPSPHEEYSSLLFDLGLILMNYCGKMDVSRPSATKHVNQACIVAFTSCTRAGKASPRSCWPQKDQTWSRPSLTLNGEPSPAHSPLTCKCISRNKWLLNHWVFTFPLRLQGPGRLAAL